MNSQKCKAEKETHNLGHDDVQIVLGLVDVRAHGHNTGDARRVGLGRPGAGGVHDGILGRTQEIGRASEAVEHAGTHDAGAVGVGVDVDLDGGVHADDAQATNDLGRVGDLLGTEEELGVVVFPL